jgi:hypothetical protein
VVLLAHVPIVLLLLRADRETKLDRPQEEVRASILYFLTPPRQFAKARPAMREARRRRPRNLRSRVAPRAPLPLPPAPNLSFRRRPSVDWHRAADEVARSLTGKRGTEVHPGSGEYPRSAYRDCARRPQFAWDPQPKRVGLIDHWLPYLRLGNHCVVSLGFFGCVVGHLPGPNGQLFYPVGRRNTGQEPPLDSSVHTWPAGEPRALCR